MAHRVPPSEARVELRRRDRTWPFLLVFLLALGGLAGALATTGLEARRQVRNEDEAVAVLQRLRAAQVVFRASSGRYGWLADLARADLLDGLELVDAPDPRHVRLEGYRVDVLLPYGRVGGENLALVSESDARAPDPELSTEHFSLVARPLRPTKSGWRIFYLDEDDRLFVNEGIVDPESAAKNPLPRTQVKMPQPQQSSRTCLWQLASEIEAENRD